MKALKIIAIIAGILFLIVLLLPYAFRSKITDLVKTELNNAVDAQIDFGKVSLSLLRSFPDFNLRINELSVVGKEAFLADTLLYTKSFDLELDLMSVFRGSPYSIKNIQLVDPLLQLIVLEDGKANWDIAAESSEEPSETGVQEDPFTIALESIFIQNARVVYDDRELVYFLSLDALTGNLNGDFTVDQTRLKASMEIGSINMSYDGMTLLSGVSGQSELTIDANLSESVYAVSTDMLMLNALDLDFKGTFSLKETAIGMDFAVAAPNGTFKQLLSLLPAAYLKDYQNLKAEGDFAFNAYMKGDYSDDSFPAFGVQLKVEKGSIAYPDLPEKIEQIALNLKVENKTTDMDQTLITLQPLQFSVKENPFRMQLRLEPPLSNPLIDTQMEGEVVLESIAGLMPDAMLANIKGKLDVNMALKAKLSALENEQINEIEAGGNAVLTAFSTPLDGWEQGLHIDKASLSISPKQLTTQVEKLQLGESSFHFSGNLQHYLAYATGNGTLEGKLNLSSEKMDVNELLAHFYASEESTEQADTASFTLDLPERLDLQFNAQIDQLLFEQYDLKAVRATISYADKTLRFDPLKANVFGGELQMAGLLDAVDQTSPLINLDFNISGFDIPMAYQGIGLFQAAAPIASKTQGSFSTKFKLKGKLDEKLQPVFSSLQGGGGLISSQIRIESVQTMNTLASLLGNDDYKRLITDGINFSFEFINGRVFQKPFSLKYAGSDVTMSGSIGFDQTLDYNLLMMIPYEKLGNQVTSGLEKLVAEAGKQGFNLNPGTNIQVKALIGGTATNPKVSIDYKDYAKNIKADINRMAQEEIEKQKQALKAELQAEADKLINEAKRQGDQLIAQADAAAETVRVEAQKAAAKLRDEGNAQAENLIAEGKKKGLIAERLAVEAAKKLREQSNKNANDIEREADQRASKIQQEARAKADALMAEANRKAALLN